MTAPSMLIPKFAPTHLSDPQLNQDPHAHYALLRRTAPVARTTDLLFRGQEGYLLTRYEDVKRLLTDDCFSSNPESSEKDGGGFGNLLQRVQLFNVLTDSMVFKDDPDHKRLRSLVNMAFTPRGILGIEQDVQRIVDDLLDDMAAKESVDLVSAFAVPLPLAVISKMLGVDETDRDRFHIWMKRFSGGAAGGPLELLRAVPSGQRMLRLFKRLVKQRRADPDDKLITGIVQANQAGDQLSDKEVLGMIFLLLLAGHDTTANLIGNSVLAFIENPDQLERLRKDPNMIDTAVEELLRFTTPVPSPAPRIPTQDVEFGRVPIPKGTPIIGMILSANRDEEVFPDPDVLDLGRSPNRHLSFGFGTHFCLGIQLARMEARIALRSLVQRFDHIELATPREQVRFAPRPLRGLESLPLRLK